MVRDNRKGLEPMKIVSALLDPPNNSKTFKFNCGIIVLSRREGRRAALNEALGAVRFLLQQGVAKAVQAGGICYQEGRECGIEVRTIMSEVRSCLSFRNWVS